MKTFWDGFEKRAAAFTHGGYAMNLIRSSKKPAQTFIQGVSRAGQAATQAAKNAVKPLAKPVVNAAKPLASESRRALAGTELANRFAGRNITTI